MEEVLARHRDNPLENILILETVFRYCDNTFDSVKTRRLVSKAWKEASGQQWRSFENPLQVIPDPDDRSAQCENLEEGGLTLSQFLKRKGIMKSRLQIPYRNLLLDGWNISDKNCVNSLPAESIADVVDVRKRFWVLYGRNITILTLRNCSFPSNSNYLFGPWFWTAVPNLEKLSLIDCKMTNVAPDRVPALSRRGAGHGHVEQFAIPLHPRIFINAQNPPFARPLLSRRPYLGARQLQETFRRLVTPVSYHGLKVLQVQNLTEFQPMSVPSVTGALVDWSRLIDSLPSLVKLSVCLQRNHTIGFVDFPGSVAASPSNLKCVDVIGMYASANEMGSLKLVNLKWNQLALDKLTLDCGFQSAGKWVPENVLNHQAATLRELHLFRAPFSSPYKSFPCGRNMDNLTELQLWGNVCADLNFLVFMPNLAVLKWNTSCYEENSHGARLHEKLRMGIVKADPQFASKIVENSEQLGESFKMEKMQSLEMFSGPISLECIKKLGEWMPMIKSLKVVIVGDEEFEEMGKQWPQLEHLELAHGSMVSAHGILEAHLTHGSFKMLRSFIWNYCPCIKTIFGVEESYAENELRRNAGRSVVLPWKGEIRQNFPLAICCQALFDKALVEGGASVSEFLSSLPK